MVVADREADFMDLLLACDDLGYAHCIRVWQNRVLVTGPDTTEGPDGAKEVAHLMDTARSWAPVAEKTVHVPARNGQKARDARVMVSYGEVDLRVPKKAPLHEWVVRAWEVDAPSDVKEPLEWVLLINRPVCSAEEALQMVENYTCRWVVEEYHQCLKTGCGIEERDFEHVDRLEHLLGFLGPLAARLLQLRDCARHDPDQPAAAVADELTVNVLAAELRISSEGMTARGFWRNVARLGGFLGRKCDGEPGWKTLWRGWLKLEPLVRGARLGLALAVTTGMRAAAA